MFSRLSNAQAKQYLDAVAVHESLVSAVHQAYDYRGGMHWKKIANKDYLYKTHDRLGNANPLGCAARKRSASTPNSLAEKPR